MVHALDNPSQPERITMEGTIIRREINQKNGPKGFFFFIHDGKEVKYTSWSQTFMDKFAEGDEVTIIYTIQENESNGRIYKNRTISAMNFTNRGTNQFSEAEAEVAVKDLGYKGKKLVADKYIKSENGVIKMGGLYYRIKEIEVELLDNGSDNGNN